MAKRVVLQNSRIKGVDFQFYTNDARDVCLCLCKDKKLTEMVDIDYTEKESLCNNRQQK